MTFRIKVRGGGGLMLAEYRCPEHGVFEATVQRDENGNPPAEVACAHMEEPESRFDDGRGEDQWRPCERASPWTISAPPVHTQFVVSATQGKSDPKPHRMSMDTRSIAEGQSYSAWRKERGKLWEERRQERVKEMLR